MDGRLNESGDCNMIMRIVFLDFPYDMAYFGSLISIFL